MQSIDTPSLIYSSLLLGAILLSVLASRRHEMSSVVKQGMMWLILFLVVIFGYGIWSDIQGNTKINFASETATGEVLIKKRADGHFYTTVMVNDKPINFLVDTGASQIVLAMKDAKTLGFDPSKLTFWNVANTANGQVRTAPVRLDSMVLGPYLETNLRASVNEGAMEISLLGMEYLNRFSSIQMSQNELKISK